MSLNPQIYGLMVIDNFGNNILTQNIISSIESINNFEYIKYTVNNNNCYIHENTSNIAINCSDNIPTIINTTIDVKLNQKFSIDFTKNTTNSTSTVNVSQIIIFTNEKNNLENSNITLNMKNSDNTLTLIYYWNISNSSIGQKTIYLPVQNKLINPTTTKNVNEKFLVNIPGNDPGTGEDQSTIPETTLTTTFANTTLGQTTTIPFSTLGQTTTVPNTTLGQRTTIPNTIPNTTNYTASYNLNNMPSLMADLIAKFPNITADQLAALINSGIDINNIAPTINNGLVINDKGISIDSKFRGPSTNILQHHYRGTTNVYSPYLYYNKATTEKYTTHNKKK